MHLSGKSLLLLAYTLLWKICKISSYETAICDEPNPSIYCSCDTRYTETTIVCFITAKINSTDEIWGALSKVENVISLKLHSMLPMRLDYIPTNSLQRMDRLKILTVQQANLGVLKSNSMSEFKELRELQLEGSDITNLEINAISNLPKLKKISLSENLLEEVLAETLVGLEDLEQLYLDRNNISRIEGCAFCDLQSLKELELWGNHITDLTEYMFRGLRYLKRLDLYKNKIRILNDKIFHTMPKLVEIDLKDNLISHIAPHAFFGLDKLQRLMLNSNKIKLLPDEVFKSLPSLRSIDLYNNELETLQVEVLKHMVNVKDEHFTMAFKENPLKCDCRLRWVKSYLKQAKSHQFSLELRELKCMPEGEDQEPKTVHLLKLTCDHSPASIKHSTTPPRSTSQQTKENITLSRSVSQPVNLVPYEIQSRENKTKSVAEDADMADGQAGARMDSMEDIDTAGGSPGLLRGDHGLLLICTSVTVFLVRRRKGT